MTDKTPEFSVTADAFLSAVVEITKMIVAEEKTSGKGGSLRQAMDRSHAIVGAFLRDKNIPFTDHRRH